MRRTGKQKTAGFTLVEVIVAIAIMGLVSAPICASLVLAGRLNARSRAALEAQLNVRAAVETLMEEGVTGASDTYRDADFPGVTIKTEQEAADDPYFKVTVSDNSSDPLVTVETYVRAAEMSASVPEGGGGG